MEFHELDTRMSSTRQKIFPAKAEIPNHQQVVIWDFCFYYGSINQISESGLLNLYAGIDLSEK